MKKLVLALVVAIGAAWPALAQDAVEGTWKTQVDDGAYAFVDMVPCGEMFCATIVRTFNDTGEYQSPNLGKPIVWDMTAKGSGRYSGGKIWQPSTGKVYRSKMSLNGDVLKVSGCIGPICKKQTWTRVN